MPNGLLVVFSAIPCDLENRIKGKREPILGSVYYCASHPKNKTLIENVFKIIVGVLLSYNKSLENTPTSLTLPIKRF